jgi:outer membrane protein assembly factor BamB
MGIQDGRLHRSRRVDDRRGSPVQRRPRSHFFALDAHDGTLLWRANPGGTVARGPMTFAVDGKQYVAVAADNTLYVFGM